MESKSQQNLSETNKVVNESFASNTSLTLERLKKCK